MKKLLALASLNSQKPKQVFEDVRREAKELNLNGKLCLDQYDRASKIRISGNKLYVDENFYELLRQSDVFSEYINDDFIMVQQLEKRCVVASFKYKGTVILENAVLDLSSMILQLL